MKVAYTFLIFLSLTLTSTVYSQQTIRPDGMGGWVVNGSASSYGPCGNPADTGPTYYASCMGRLEGTRQFMEEQKMLLMQQQIQNQRLQNEAMQRLLDQQQGKK